MSLNVVPGTIIESIDGEPIAADADPARYLNRKADRRTLLVIRDGDEHRELVVPTYSISKIAAETMVRFGAREWGIPAIIASWLLGKPCILKADSIGTLAYRSA